MQRKFRTQLKIRVMKFVYSICIIGIILSLNFMKTEEVNDYKQEKVSFLIDYLKKNKKKIDNYNYQLETNGAFVYILGNSEVVLLPGNLSSYENGLIIKNEEVLKKMIKNDYFPVDVVDFYQFEIYKDKLVNLPDHVNENITSLERDLDMEILNRAKYDEVFFKTFNEAIKKIDLKKNKDKYTLSLSILLGEIIIKNKGGYWQITKEYGTYNPYYVPFVVLNDSKIELAVMEKIMSDLEQPQFFDLKYSYNYLTDPRFNMQLNPSAQKLYKDIKKERFGNTED